VEVGSELANETIPIVYFLPDVVEELLLVVAPDDELDELDDAPDDEPPPDDVLLLLLLVDPQPAATTATTTAIRAPPSAVRKRVRDTTFSSPTAWESGGPYSKYEIGVKFNLDKFSANLKTTSTSISVAAHGPPRGSPTGRRGSTWTSS
jgi:hypothetical protein